VKDELHDPQIALRLADAAMHCGDYKNAQRAFSKIAAQKIDSKWEIQKQTRIATETCEARIKSIALSYCISVLKIEKQVRKTRKPADTPIAMDKISNEEVIGISRKSLLLDALFGNAWYNLARANKLLGNDEDAMLCYLMAGTCRTPDNEAWLEALLLASKLKNDVFPPLVGYLQLARAEEFARYLAEAAARSSDEPSRNVLVSLGQLFAQNASSTVTAEFRFHGKDNWKSIHVPVG
jgi:tetratricopeptide (TPR) repeat protein